MVQRLVNKYQVNFFKYFKGKFRLLAFTCFKLMSLLQAMYKWKLEIEFLIKKNFTRKARANYRGMKDQTHKAWKKKIKWIPNHVCIDS